MILQINLVTYVTCDAKCSSCVYSYFVHNMSVRIISSILVQSGLYLLAGDQYPVDSGAVSLKLNNLEQGEKVSTLVRDRGNARLLNHFNKKKSIYKYNFPVFDQYLQNPFHFKLKFPILLCNECLFMFFMR